MTNSPGFRTHYPVRAVAAIAATSLLLAFNVVVGFLFMALVPPFIPVYIGVLFSGGALVESALRYARRVSIRYPTAMLRSDQHEEEGQGRSAAARAT